MAAVQLSGQEQAKLQEVLKEAFPSRDFFTQFLWSQLGVRLENFPGSYDESLAALLRHLSSSNERRIRELLRKAATKKPGYSVLDAIAQEHLSEHEALVSLLEKGEFDWDDVLHWFQAAAPDSRQLFGWESSPIGPNALAEYATRYGDLVDLLTAAPERPREGLRLPLLIFAAAAVQAAPTEDLARDLRRWVKNTARAKGVRVRDLLIVHLPDDDTSVSRLVEALSRIDVVALPQQWSALSTTPWSDVVGAAGRELGQTAVMISRESRTQWLASVNSEPWPDWSGAAQTSVFPILLNLPREQVTLPFMQPHRSVVLNEPFVEAEITAFKHRLNNPPRQRRGDHGDGAEAAPLLDTVVKRFASAAVSDTIVILLGPAASPPPTGYHVSWRLLRTLLRKELIEGEDSVSLGDDGLVLPIDLAGTFYAIKNTDAALFDRIREYGARLTNTLPPTHVAVASLIAAMPRTRDTPRNKDLRDRRPLIVTTNLDLTTERALVLSGVSFTRVVQRVRRRDRELPLVLSHFGITRHTDGTGEYRVSSNSSNDAVRFRVQPGDDPANEPPAFLIDDDNWRALDRLIEAAPRLEGIELPPLEQDTYRPILYKYHGSLDVANSEAISSDHFDAFDFERSVPQTLAQKVQNQALLVLGYCYTDPQFRHLRRTLLKSIPDTNVARYSILYPLPSDPDGALYRLERELSGELAHLWQGLRGTGIEGSGPALIMQILGRLEGRGRTLRDSA